MVYFKVYHTLFILILKAPPAIRKGGRHCQRKVCWLLGHEGCSASIVLSLLHSCWLHICELIYETISERDLHVEVVLMAVWAATGPGG